MKLRSAHSPLVPVIALLLAMISIQGGAALAKQLFPYVGAQGATALRLGFAAPMLLVLWKPWRVPVTKAAAGPILIYGVALGGMNLLFYMAIRTTPLAIAVALEFVGPLAVALFSSRRPVDLCWVALASFGILLLLPGNSGPTPLDPVGVGLALGAGACWAVYILSGKRAAASGGRPAVAYGTTIAAVFVMPIGITHAGADLFTIEILPLALVVALLTSAIPYSLEMLALDRLSTRVFGVLTSMEPALASISALLILGERLSMMQVGGVGTIMAASIAVIITRNSAVPVPA
jgi:inner membrane transporter RhtA